MITTKDGLKLKREYTDLNGNRRTAKFKERGPTGNRWIMEDGSMLTIDYAEMTQYKTYAGKQYRYSTSLFNPWLEARDVVDTYEQ